MFSRFDQWKLDYPDDTQQEVGKCDHCQSTLFHGDTAYYDSRDATYTFCSVECFKEWVIHHIEEEIDYYVELLEEKNDTYNTILHFEEEEE